MLPETLDVVDALAASLLFDPVLTARDRSLLFAVSWYAAKHPPGHGEDAMVPDLPLRRSLGDMRRPDESREFARYRRLQDATMRTDETMPDLMDGALVPTVPSGMRRITLSGARAWDVSPEIVRSFSIARGDAVVGVPLIVLARARCRYTLPLVLRLLAWGAGGHPAKWRRIERDDHYVLRIPLETIRAELGCESKGAFEALRADLQPAIDEVRLLTDLVVDTQPYYAPSIRKPKGRVLGFDVVVGKVKPRTAAVSTRPQPAEIVPINNEIGRPFGFRPPPKTFAGRPGPSPRPGS